MKIYVSGSIAKDLIMDFPGRFRDFIDPKKIHVLNLSFAVENLKENLGGTAANICYNLSLFKERPVMIGNLGQDQRSLLDYFLRHQIETGEIRIFKQRTAAAYIITDLDDNQITGFHAGAMNQLRKQMPKVKKGDWAIIAPEFPKNMVRLAKHYQKEKVNYIFDPGQQITALSIRDLQSLIRGAKIVIGNDYEIGLLTPAFSPEVRGRVRGGGFTVIRTLGPKGSEILAGGEKIRIGIAKPLKIVDPTGAGDAYRAGLLKGLVLGYNLETCARLGATAASFAVEKYGTQNHKFNTKSFLQRYNSNFLKRLSFRA